MQRRRVARGSGDRFAEKETAMSARVVAVLIALSPLVASAEPHAAPYAGRQHRAVASLSAEDIETLRAGGGWGLALPAELNGAPGPAHLLELRDGLGLSPGQVAAVEAMEAAMRTEAIAAGDRLIAAEQALDAAFRAGDLTPERLRGLVAASEDARAALRLAHLSRHLATAPLLTDAQIARYRALRGYGADPRAEPAQGHRHGSDD
jgi:hypothetical protein